jgi:hypothetical protein
MEFDIDRSERLKHLGKMIVLWLVLAAVGAGMVVGIAVYFGNRSSQGDADR